MATARCSCGSVTLTLTGPPALVVSCHCTDCQRRSGSPYGVGAYYPEAAATITGETREYTRPGASGRMVRNHFCPVCGTSVFWYADRLPGHVAVAVGALADPSFPPPDRSVFEETRLSWVGELRARAHFRHGSDGAPQS